MGVAGELVTLANAAGVLGQCELGSRLADCSQRLVTARRQVIWEMLERLSRNAEQASVDVVNAALAGTKIAERRSDESNDRS